jgi:enoyl-CoA hydratase/carnithine racemase
MDSTSQAASDLCAPEVGVLYDPSNFVGTIEIRRPPHNYFNGDVLADVAEIARKLADRGARALVLCSEGKNFCAGADFGNAAGPSGGGRTDVYEIGISLLEQPLPIVAAIQGGVIGGGVGLALVADFRVAAPSSYFWVNFARLGLHHGFGLTVTLPRVIGYQAATELLYTGRRIDGTTARQMGLCDYLVPADELRSKAHELAGEMAAAAPLAVQGMRRTMRSALAREAKAAMDAERVVQNELIKTADFKEGTTAVRERRQPQFMAR